MGLAKELAARTAAIAAIFSLVSYRVLVGKETAQPGRLEYAIPLLFVTCGIVMLINILFSLRKYRVMDVR